VTVRLAEIWRHPIKVIGRERLVSADLAAAAPLPGDRAWAVLHEGGEDTDAWQPRRNFLQAASGPSLMAVQAAADGDALTLTHPERPAITLRLPQEEARLLDWIRPLWPADRPAPRRLVAAPAQGMADNGTGSMSLLNRASLAALSEAHGRSLDMRRFRGNLILDGAEPWAEWDWLGRHLRIGTAELEVVERIGRCRATEADPATGRREGDPVRTLRENWGHTDFGVYAIVRRAGRISEGCEGVLQ
jgi:uncharacterized protein YcbX